MSLDMATNKTGLLFKGSKAEDISVVLATQYEDGLQPMILKDRKLEKYQRIGKHSVTKELGDSWIFNRLIVLEKKHAYVPLCNMGFVPFCISSSHVSMSKKSFRTNYCMYYDNDLCVAAISEGFGSFANELSYISCREAVRYLIGLNLEPKMLDNVIDHCLKEVESRIEKVEQEYPEDLDTLLTGASLAVLVIYKGQIASGIIGDSMLLKLNQSLDGGKVTFQPINSGLQMNSEEDREKIYSSHGEMRKNVIGKECIYIKGREYPESPMIASIGCRLGKEIGMSSDPYINREEHMSLFDRQGMLILCNQEFYTRIAKDEENMKLLSCITLNDANSIREYIYGKLKIQYLQKGNPIDDAIGLIFIMDKETTANAIQRP